ncbi:MAG: hypothetical protein U5Q44_10620 [Dehalococcoidia bacterium]|nr:hypothetical protein [Dehalococcoidia bacterium]
MSGHRVCRRPVVWGSRLQHGYRLQVDVLGVDMHFDREVHLQALLAEQRLDHDDRPVQLLIRDR